MTHEPYPIQDTLASACGASACLAQIATQLTDAASAEPSTPELLKHVAATIHAQAQRASLAIMSLAAHAGRLEAFAVAKAIAVAAARAEHAAAREAIEAEAATDARNYVNEGEIADAATYAGEAFAAWTADEGGPEAVAPLGLDEARAIYVAAFMRAVGGAS